MADCVAAVRRSTRSMHLSAASSRLAMSREDMPVLARDPAQSSVGARRTVHGIQDSDIVPSARATSGSPLCLPPEPTAAARTHSQRSRWEWARNMVRIHRFGADPFLPNAEAREASALLRWRVAPAVAGIHDS